MFVNHYQRLAKLEDVVNATIDTGTVTFPPLHVSGEISFFMPFHMDLSGSVLNYATAQPICRQGDTYFFVQIPGIAPEYQLSEGRTFTPDAGTDSIIHIDGISIVTLTWEQARYLRRLDGELYLGDGCDLFIAEGKIRAVEDGDLRYWRWNEGGFEEKFLYQPYSEPVVTYEAVGNPPFDPKHTEGIHIGGARKVTWQKVTVTGSQGFVNIDYVGDAAQIYVEGELTADSYYYGEVWRVPARLLDGKECYLGVSEFRNDFYNE